MAAKSKFRIPTAKEMAKLDSSASSVLPLFKRGDAGKVSGSIYVNNQKNKQQTNNDSAKMKVSAVEPSSSSTIASLKKVTATTSSAPESPTKKDTADKIQADDGKTVLRKDAILQPITKPSRANCVIVNPRQRGNPIIKHIRNIPWEFGDTPADYELGKATCALYLSIRYHQLNPEYIHERLKKLGHSYDLRVMLVQVDVNNPHHALKELAKICILADYTLILAFSPEEAGRYLETYKIYENKPPDAVMEKTEQNFLAKFTDCVTSVKSVNKTDCMTVLTNFGSFDKITKASVEELSFCPGFGPQKAQRLYSVLHEPFLKDPKRKAADKKGVKSSDTSKADHSPSKLKK